MFFREPDSMMTPHGCQSAISRLSCACVGRSAVWMRHPWSWAYLQTPCNRSLIVGCRVDIVRMNRTVSMPIVYTITSQSACIFIRNRFLVFSYGMI